MDDFVEELKEKIVEFLGLEDVELDAVKPEDPLITEGLGLDSVDLLELVVLLEKEYDIKIATKEEATEAFQSLGGLADYIRENRPGQE